MANSSEKMSLPQRNLIGEISSKSLHNLFLFEEMIHRNNESSLKSTHLRLPNVGEIKSLMIPSYMIELRKLIDSYLTSEQNSFWLKNRFQVALEQYRVLAATCYGVVIPLMGKNVSGDWIDDKIESWFATSDSIDDKERESLAQFSTLRAEKGLIKFY
ncbi:hypothetical protein YC2023_115103 [Brassica napus]